MTKKIEKINLKEVRPLIREAVREDYGKGDVTSELFKKDNTLIKAEVVAREGIIVCGTVLIKEILKFYDLKLKVKVNIKDGEKAYSGDSIATMTGPFCSMLSAERVVLNFMQRLSGIATTTRKYVDEIKSTNAKLYDTRKTIPGWRNLEKYAVRCGGGFNHRFGLYDAILIKDNHIAQLENNLKSGLEKIIKKVKKLKNIKFVEIEVDNLEQLKNILNIKGIEIILLDNMAPDLLKKAIKIKEKYCKNKKLLLEASGGINLKNIKNIAKTGVDRISSGAITHSAISVDIGLDRKLIKI